MKLHDLTKVKLKTAGNTSVVQFTAGNNKTCSVVNLSKDTYLDKKTGEVKRKKKSESRYQSPKGVRKSINRLIDLIWCNATDSAKCNTEGKTSQQALICISRRLISIIYGMLKNGTEYRMLVVENAGENM